MTLFGRLSPNKRQWRCESSSVFPERIHHQLLRNSLSASHFHRLCVADRNSWPACFACSLACSGFGSPEPVVLYDRSNAFRSEKEPPQMLYQQKFRFAGEGIKSTIIVSNFENELRFYAENALHRPVETSLPLTERIAQLPSCRKILPLDSDWKALSELAN